MIDTNFIHDLSQLDSIRQKSLQAGNKQQALTSAARQFEALFTQMMFKAMRDANQAFESDLIDNRTSKFYQQMSDEQLVSNLSQHGSLGLADLIVKQLASHTSSEQNIINEPIALLRNESKITPAAKAELPPIQAQVNSDVSNADAAEHKKQRIISEPDALFNSPNEFVTRLLPHAQKAAKLLGTEPAVLLAQAALETGWGQKVIMNGHTNSHNLFNIKADNRWQGDKIAVTTLEYSDDIPAPQRASFRSYLSYQQSFDDYVDFLQTNPRYQDALKVKSPEQFIANLHQAGYATDPQYTNKVIGVLHQVNAMIE